MDGDGVHRIAIIPIALPFLVMLIGARAIAGSEERQDARPAAQQSLCDAAQPDRRSGAHHGHRPRRRPRGSPGYSPTSRCLFAGVDLGGGPSGRRSRGALALLPVLRLAGPAALGRRAPGSARHHHMPPSSSSSCTCSTAWRRRSPSRIEPAPGRLAHLPDWAPPCRATSRGRRCSSCWPAVVFVGVAMALWRRDVYT